MEIETPTGTARVELHEAEAPRAWLLLGHGAGGGIGATDLLASCEAALELGVSVGLVEQPYRVAGRRAPAPAGQLDAAWLAVAAAVQSARPAASLGPAPPGPGSARPAASLGPAPPGPGSLPSASPGPLPLYVGGRSSGARVACRTAAAAGAAGVICLAFPLHPPGKPEKSRLPELDGVAVPVLVVQGERDPFGMPPPGAGRNIVVVAGNHSLRAKGPVHAAVSGWLASQL
jgi:predicted alpha/beta-hydrolase family hydrolase